MYSEGNHQQNEKIAYEMGENICKWSNCQGVIFPNTLTAHTVQYQKTKQPNQKMGRRSK